MASSNQGKGQDDAVPVGSTGRSFASKDPERVREVVPAPQPGGGAKKPDEQLPADEAGHQDGGSGAPAVNPVAAEGGSGRR